MDCFLESEFLGVLLLWVGGGMEMMQEVWAITLIVSGGVFTVHTATAAKPGAQPDLR